MSSDWSTINLLSPSSYTDIFMHYTHRHKQCTFFFNATAALFYVLPHSFHVHMDQLGGQAHFTHSILLSTINLIHVGSNRISVDDSGRGPISAVCSKRQST